MIDITGWEQMIGRQLVRIQRELEDKFSQEEIFIPMSEVQRI